MPASRSFLALKINIYADGGLLSTLRGPHIITIDCGDESEVLRKPAFRLKGRRLAIINYSIVRFSEEVPGTETIDYEVSIFDDEDSISLRLS